MQDNNYQSFKIFPHSSSHSWTTVNVKLQMREKDSESLKYCQMTDSITRTSVAPVLAWSCVTLIRSS